MIGGGLRWSTSSRGSSMLRRGHRGIRIARGFGMSRVRCLATLLAAVVAVAGCGGREGKPPGGEAQEGPPPAELGTYLNVVLPSVIRRGEPFPVRVSVLTQAGLPDYDFQGALRLETSGRATLPEGGLKLEPRTEGLYEGTGLVLEDPGVQLVRGSVPGDTVAALGNPVNVVEGVPEWRILWGDLNGHSDESSGSRPPAVYWWYAKSIALLDFAVLTDNDQAGDKTMTDARFRELAGVAEEVDESGRFAPILGFEWSSPAHGNRLVLFSKAPETLPTPAAGVDAPAKLREAVPEGSVLVIPHPSGSENDPPTDPAEAGSGGEALVEVYSAQGTFERAETHRPATRETSGAFVTDLLARGFRPGFVASGDTRLTTPGNPRPLHYGDHLYPGGLTAVLAKELTRDAVLEALRARRCYATTGPRFLLEFTVDGKPMGSELRVPRGHVAKAYGSLGSATRWTRVEIVGPEGPLGVLTPEPASADVVELRAETPPVEGPVWLYLRGIDERGDMAWSSPVYLSPE